MFIHGFVPGPGLRHANPSDLAKNRVPTARGMLLFLKKAVANGAVALLENVQMVQKAT